MRDAPPVDPPAYAATEGGELVVAADPGRAADADGGDGSSDERSDEYSNECSNESYDGNRDDGSWASTASGGADDGHSASSAARTHASIAIDDDARASASTPEEAAAFEEQGDAFPSPDGYDVFVPVAVPVDDALADHRISTITCVSNVARDPSIASGASTASADASRRTEATRSTRRAANTNTSGRGAEGTGRVVRKGSGETSTIMTIDGSGRYDIREAPDGTAVSPPNPRRRPKGDGPKEPEGTHGTAPAVRKSSSEWDALIDEKMRAKKKKREKREKRKKRQCDGTEGGGGGDGDDGGGIRLEVVPPSVIHDANDAVQAWRESRGASFDSRDKQSNAKPPDGVQIEIDMDHSSEGHWSSSPEKERAGKEEEEEEEEEEKKKRRRYLLGSLCLVFLLVFIFGMVFGLKGDGGAGEDDNGAPQSVETAPQEDAATATSSPTTPPTTALPSTAPITPVGPWWILDAPVVQVTRPPAEGKASGVPTMRPPSRSPIILLEETTHAVNLILQNVPGGYVLPRAVRNSLVSFVENLVRENLDGAVKLVGVVFAGSENGSRGLLDSPPPLLRSPKKTRRLEAIVVPLLITVLGPASLSGLHLIYVMDVLENTSVLGTYLRSLDENSFEDVTISVRSDSFELDSLEAAPGAAPIGGFANACDDDALTCPDGVTVVSRNPFQECNFVPCPNANQPLPTDVAAPPESPTSGLTNLCENDVQTCPQSGATVLRNPFLDCNFFSCPDGEPSVPKTSTTSPTSSPPTSSPIGVNQVPTCNKDQFACPGGSMVPRNPFENCEFFPCREDPPAAVSPPSKSPMKPPTKPSTKHPTRSPIAPPLQPTPSSVVANSPTPPPTPPPTPATPNPAPEPTTSSPMTALPTRKPVSPPPTASPTTEAPTESPTLQPSTSTSLVCSASPSLLTAASCPSAGTVTLDLLEHCASSDTVANDQYGNALAVASRPGGDVYAVVGARFHERSGSAYLLSYDRGSRRWNHIAEFVPGGASANGVNFNPQQSSYDQFGTDVVISDDWVAISAPLDTASTGKVSLFRLDDVRDGDQLEPEFELVAADKEPLTRFGTSLAINEDALVVGAARDRRNVGSAYIFEYNSVTGEWAQAAKLAPDDASADSQGNFGNSVAVLAAAQGGIVVVGAPYDGTRGRRRNGAVYVYSGMSHALLQKIVPSQLLGGDQFGSSLAAATSNNPSTNKRETRIAVGARLRDDRGIDSGSVYVYVRREGESEFSLEQRLTSSDWSPYAGLGSSIDMHQDKMLVGAVGRAHVFQFNGVMWQDTGFVSPLNAGAAENDGDKFGSAVALTSSVALVGSYSNNDAGENGGKMYSYAVCN